MKKFVVTCCGLLLAISAASPNCWAADLKFDGSVDNAFLTPNNWSEITFPIPPPDLPPVVTPVATVPGAGDRANINDGFVVSYATAASTTVTSLIVGGDATQMSGDFGTPGRLNMSAGMITVSGGSNSFEIARACCNDVLTDVSVVELTGDAVLTALGSDPIVGTRDAGQLLIRDTASVIANPPSMTFPGNHWRLGNYGPSFDPGIGGLQGDGLLDVSDMGSFSAHVIFIGDNDSTGELRVSDNGSVILTGNLVPRPSGFFAAGSASVRMSGSTATLEAFNLESESLAGEIPTKYTFDADPVGGVSPIKLTDAINIGGNDLVVNLNGFPLPFGAPLLLFDGDQALAGGRIFGTFASSIVNGSVVPHVVIYDQVNGDIYVQRVPEPSTMLLLGLGLVIAFSAKRRASR